MELEKKTKRRKEIFDHGYIVKPNGCWEWQKYVSTSGYGITSFRKDHQKSCRISAHRYSYERFKGPIPEGMHVCHTCDNRKCVNPDHLWLGTALDNMRDKGKKGNQCRGETIGVSLLSENDVKEIKKRLLNGDEAKYIAIDFSICLALVYHIKNGRSWSHSLTDSEKKKLKNLKAHRAKKLTEKMVLEIRARYAKGERVSDLAREFGVNTTMISRIKNRKGWTHI